MVVDHYLLGDGSKGLRTQRTSFIDMLLANGFERWTRLEVVDEVVAALGAVLGAERVLVSCDGFNAVGGRGGVQGLPSAARREGSDGIHPETTRPGLT